MLFAQSNGEATENLRATLQANGQGILLQWWGKSGRTYFVQTSPNLNLSVEWSYEGHVLTGTGTLLSISLPAQPSPSFIRLRYTDQPVTGDPYEADPDQDGLSNRKEIQTHGTNPLDSDSDDDGLPDGWEVQYGLSPLSVEGSHGAQGDPDGDTLKNLIEYQLGSSPINADTDGDVLPDWWEFRNQTSLISNLGQDGPTGDIDHDGYTNLEEYRVLSDPRNASSYPGSGGPRQEFGGTGTNTPDPSFATFLARRVRHMSFGSHLRHFRPDILDWVIYYEHEVPNANPPPPSHDNFNGDADVNENTLDPGDPRDTPSPWEPTFWEPCEPDAPGAVMRKELGFSEINFYCDTPVEEERHSTYWITNAYPGDGGRLEVESSSLEFSRATALAAMESLPMYQGSPEDGWMGAGRWGTFVSTVTSQWDHVVDEEEVIQCDCCSGLVEETYPFYMSSATMDQEQVRYQCNQPAPAALTQSFVLVKRQKALSEYGSNVEYAESVKVLGSLELRIEEGQMISSQASASFPLPEGVSLQGGTILLTSPPVAPGNRASYDLLPVEVKVRKKGGSSPTDDRLLVKVGEPVELLTGLTTQTLPDDKVQWFLRQLKKDGSYASWETVGTGNVCEILPMNTGIFQAKAVIEGTAFEYKRKTDDPHSSLKTGNPNAFGVYVGNWQKAVLDRATIFLGTTDYRTSGSLPSGDPFGLFTGHNKCNAFVADVLEGTSVEVDPPVNGVYYASPPSANNWAGVHDPSDPLTPYPIPGWNITSDNPSPGYVVARGFSSGSVSGHCGIVDFDGQWISAGPVNVNRRAEFVTYTGEGGSPASQRNR